jgi:hypothetical protein
MYSLEEGWRDMYDNPLTAVKIHRWKSSTEKEDHTLDNFYMDFTMEEAVNRIGVYISQNNNEPFYVWFKNKPLLFTIKNPKWKGYNVNPFKAVDLNAEVINEPVDYDYHNDKLFMCNNIINIVFAKDLPKLLQKNKYYFIPELKTQTLKYYRQHDAMLANLKDNKVQITNEYYSRLNYLFKLKRQIILADIFDKCHASKHVDMIQWVDDPTKVLYKLYKKHKIKSGWFTSWTNTDKITQINVIHMYSIVNKTSYCKLSINNEGNVLLAYVLDARYQIKLNEINRHKKRLSEFLQNLLKQRVSFEEISINSVARLEIYNSSFKLLIKKLSEYIDIFHVIKSEISKKKSMVTCTYKRSSNYSQNMDIYDYIKSRINLGISKQEITDELLNLGVTGNIDQMIADEVNMQNDISEKPKVNIQNYGVIIMIEASVNGYIVVIQNCPNLQEMNYLLYWISRIITVTIDKKLGAPVVPAVPARPTIIPSPASSYSSASIDHGSLDIDIDDFDDMGGGSGKSSYLISMLQQADKELFGENYARDKCQNPSQPVVFSKSYKEKLENENNFHFDNVIEYGSNSKNMNYYACPRLWCPQSKIPLAVDDPNAKCPLENETPMQMFWNNDKSKKRFVKLIKPNEKGMCVPCCMKKEPKAEEINKCMAFVKNEVEPKMPSPVQEETDENYIMNQTAPIPVGRYGNIPEYLHRILFPDSKDMGTCNKSLQKGQPCFVRKGIQNKKNKYDSSLYAISDALGFKTKRELIKDIMKRLDLITFLSLDDGNICKQFMSQKEMLPSANRKLVKSFNKFDKQNMFKVSSQSLNIFYAYTRYIDYLASEDFNNAKDPIHFYSLISMLYDTSLIVWEKVDKSNEVLLNCPHLTLLNIDYNPSIIMIIKEGDYYEPIELKYRSMSPVKVFKINDYPQIMSLLQRCNMTLVEKLVTTYRNLYTLHNWVKSDVLKFSKKFTLKTIVINDDFTIDKILTHNHIMITFDKIGLSFIPIIMKNFNISHVLFYHDLTGNSYKINVLKTDVTLFADKCDSLNINVLIGNVKEETDYEYYSTIDFTKHIPDSSDMILHSNTSQAIVMTDNKSKLWYELQKLVIKQIIKKYDTDDKLKILNDMARQDKIRKLLEIFEGYANQKKIQIILEEIPTNSIHDLTKWLSYLSIYTKYNFYSNAINENKKQNEFVFSQNALISNGEKKIPSFLLAYHKSLPALPILHEMVNITYTDSDKRDINQIPRIFVGKHVKLGSKWVMHKKSKWTNMIYIKDETYDKDSMAHFVVWLADKLHLKITYKDVLMTVRQKLIDAVDQKDNVDDKEIMQLLLQEPSFFKSCINVSKRKFQTVQIFLDTFYLKLSTEQKRNYLQQVLDQNDTYTNDMHIMAISHLFNVSILVLHRGKYGKSDQSNRGDTADLLLSSTFYPASVNMQMMPLIIFNRVNEKTHNAYYLVVDEGLPIESCIYMKYIEVPLNIKVLTDRHIS